MPSKNISQEFLEAQQIREGVIILKNNALRAILMISSLNFALRSEKEQSAIIYQFQSFLNSLDFTCQIIVQSRKLNITGYVDKLTEKAEKQKNELLKNQTINYREFIKELIKKGSIMSKTFFVVVPYTIIEAQGGISPSQLIKETKIPKLTEGTFQRCKTQLWHRMEFLALGLRRCGLQSIPLTTSEIIEYFWTLHHLKEAETGYYPQIPSELKQ